MVEKMDIQWRDIETVKPYERNAKKHPDDQVGHIANSLQRFGWKQPLVVDKDGVVVVGHGRLLAAKKLGLKTVPCVCADDLTEDEIKAFRLADNKTNESAWDDELLDLELDELAELDDIDMSDYGFELSDGTAEQTEVAEDNYDGEVPEEPRAKIGDLWQLGSHRLICGDSTDPAVIDRLMDGVKADIAITSPPYGESKSAGIRNHYEKGKTRIDTLYKSHDDNIAHWYDLVQGSFLTMRSATKAQFINIQMLADNKRDLLRFLNENKDWFVDVIVWDKKKAPPQMESNILNNAFEFIFCFCDEGASRKIPFGDFHGNVTNIIELPCGHNEYADIHKAVYPVELPARIMEIAKSAKSILDPFGGTGSTLIACEQLNRKCYMCELDPHYIDVIIDRWETFTGKKAVLLNAER